VGIPRSLWWLVLTAAIVAALVGISYLALAGLRPNAVWSEMKPHCPHCRTDIPYYAQRCPTCREELDWVVSPEEDSPWCTACATKPEMQRMLAGAKALGETATISRLAAALALPEPAARAWWKALEAGRCGWCGGTGKDLGAAGDAECPVCFGGEACIGCDGDLFTRLGNERAARDRDRMKRELAPLQGPKNGAYWKEHRALARDYLRRHAGTSEATQVAIDPLPPSVAPEPPAVEALRYLRSSAGTSAGIARKRVEAAIRALSE
jgi:hypothetical protein